MLMVSYIGYTKKQLNERFNEHVNEANRGSSRKLKRAIRKYGVNHFSIELVDSTDLKEHALHMEISYISKFDSKNSGYNMTSGAGKYLRDYGLTLNTLLNKMKGILPKRNREKYEKCKWKIYEVRRIKY